MGLFRKDINPYSRAATDDHFYCKVWRRPGNINDLNISGFPVITMMITTVYTFCFFVTPGDMVDRLSVLPLDDFSLLHLMLTTVGSAFSHMSISHLFMNMLFLWVFGTLLEPRLTPGQYLSAALLGSVLSRLISLNLLVSQVDLLDPSSNLLQYPPAGASGAIAGLMGCFVVRYSFSGRSLKGGLHCRPLAFSRVPISATMLIGLFFVRDLVGHAAPAFGLTGMADFWGHMGALLGGLVLALVSTLQDEDPGERQEDTGKRSDGGLKRREEDRYQLELAIPAPAYASIDQSFLSIKPPCKETHQGINATGCRV